MMRNDYRRALILLRGNAPRCSGHVRLERRTLMGSMYFQVQAPAEYGSLRAALVGRGRDNYFACALGELSRDGRGQGTLGYSFDPRSICGHELEDYQLIVVSGDGCEILLYGNVCGHADVNWERVRTAVCGLYTAGIARGEPESPADAAAEEQAGEESGEAAEPQAPDEEAPQTQAPLPDGQESAGDRLDLDMSLPWPGDAEPLRQLFMVSPPLEKAPDDEFVYIAAPMPEESGYPYVAVGIRAERGEPAAVRYALPDRWSAEPPAGLEDYHWVGDANAGWWVTEADIYPDGHI